MPKVTTRGKDVSSEANKSFGQKLQYASSHHAPLSPHSSPTSLLYKHKHKCLLPHKSIHNGEILRVDLRIRLFLSRRYPRLLPAIPKPLQHACALHRCDLAEYRCRRPPPYSTGAPEIFKAAVCGAEAATAISPGEH